MPVSNPEKRVHLDTIPCGGTTQVTLGFTAAPELLTEPADIVLVLDRSSSMEGPRLPAVKSAAKDMLDMIALASGGEAAHHFAGGTRVGLVSFSSTATTDAPLGTELMELDAIIDQYTADGWTGHAEAFLKAAALLDDEKRRRVIVMFTDGETNIGEPPAPVAEAIRETGVEIFCIGMEIEEAVLDTWATAPSDRHVAMAANVEELAPSFAHIGQEVIRAGGSEVVVDEVLSPAFQIADVQAPSHGTVKVNSPHALTWTMDAVGVTGTERAELTFDATHVGPDSGTMPINAEIHYQDRDGSGLQFPDPKITVNCTQEPEIIPEPCPEPVVFTLQGCQDAARVDLGQVDLGGLGRIVQVCVTIRNVCPDKRVAVAVVLSETDANGDEHPRGMKTFVIPAQHGRDCQDVKLRCIPFVLPESLDVSGGDPESLCNPRTFQALVFANYLDTDFACCEASAQP